MAAEGVIDLDQELQGLFNKEEMRAFFDVTVSLGNGRTASGICKVSEQKTHESGSTYFSLLFLIDVPEGITWTVIDAIMSAVKWNEFQKYLIDTESVVSMSIPGNIKDLYIRETYVYVRPPRIPDDDYIRILLYPAVGRVTGFETGEPVLWDNTQFPAMAAGEKKDKTEGYPPSLAKLKRLLQS
ncbi:MAG TPA: hypothetical protein VGJ94_18675 [Syntrophorhabdaceae bacterium]|jgi:hypothetical protein